MASQAALTILEEHPGGRVKVVLACGCEVELVLDENRLITTDDGTRLVIGKYPCPLGHPVRKP